MIPNIKKLYIIHIMAFAAIIICTGCSPKGTTGRSDEKPKFTTAQSYGLQGPVKIVKNGTTKQTIVFNKIGNIESFISDNGYDNRNDTYIYESPSRYTINGIEYRTECIGDTLRVINEPDEDIFRYEDEYVFDNMGRVVMHNFHEGMMGARIDYEYLGDNRLPDKETYSSSDEYGDWSTTIDYQYIDIDNHGNWTKRIGYSKAITNDYEEVMDDNGEYLTKTTTTESTDITEESRTITYY